MNNTFIANALFVFFLLSACSGIAKYPTPPVNLFSNNNQGAEKKVWIEEIIPQACASGSKHRKVKSCTKKGKKYLEREASPAIIVGNMCRQFTSYLSQASCFKQAADNSRHGPLLTFKNSCADTQKTPKDFVRCINSGYNL